MSFNQHLKQGHATEDIVAALYEEAGCQVRSTANDIPRPPYDLELVSPHGRRLTVEVKSWDDDRGTCFETSKCGRTPEYIKESSRVDLMVRYHKSSGVATEIDNKKLVNYLKSNIKTRWETKRFKGGGATTTEHIEKYVGDEGGLGVVLDVTDPAIGYRRTL
jgi:hypothetical protein